MSFLLLQENLYFHSISDLMQKLGGAFILYELSGVTETGNYNLLDIGKIFVLHTYWCF